MTRSKRGFWAVVTAIGEAVRLAAAWAGVVRP
jgi:hypothetical protein